MSFIVSAAFLLTLPDLRISDIEIKAGDITTNATVIAPIQPGKKPAVLYFHWLGSPQGNRNEFMAEAVSMARRGAVCMLIEGRTPWKVPFIALEADKKSIEGQVAEVRRAIAHLRSRSDVDGSHVVYVGHDYGAMHGARVSAEDTKMAGWVFVAGMGSYADWSLKYWPKTAAKGESSYRDGIRPLDPIMFIGKSTGSPRLFQFAKKDEYITEAQANEFFNASSEPKKALWYDEEHDMRSDRARLDRVKWVCDRLGLKV